jgi:hypothetical protein
LVRHLNECAIDPGTANLLLSHFVFGPGISETIKFIDGYLAPNWKRVLNLHYGMSKTRDVLFAVLYVAANRPSTQSDLQDLWTQYMLTLKCYLEKGIPWKQAALQLASHESLYHKAIVDDNANVKTLDMKAVGLY